MGFVCLAIVHQLVILYFFDYRIAGVVPCTENIPADEVTVHSHAWIYNDHFNESETGQIGNLGFSLDPYIKCKCMHILRISFKGQVISKAIYLGFKSPTEHVTISNTWFSQ